MTDLTCPTTGTLRGHLDHPVAEVEAHLDGCDACRDTIVTVADNAGTTARLIAALDAPPVPGPQDPRPSAPIGAKSVPARVRPRSRARATAESTRPATRPGVRRPRGRRALVGIGAVVAVALAFTPVGSTAVAQLADAFRADRVQPIELDLANLAAATDLEGLAELGTVTWDGDHTGPTEVADAAAALAIAGVEPLAIPADGPTTTLAVAPTTATITLRATATNGVPAELDGAAMVMALPGAAATMVASDGGMPSLVAGRAGAVTVSATGAELADIREFLLGRDELPAALRAQLAAIEDWRHTLPLPVPAGGIGWDEITVGGHDGLAFGDDSGLAGVVMWQVDGVIHGVAGPRPVSELRDIAEGL